MSRFKVLKSRNYSQKIKINIEKFDARCQLQSKKLVIGLKEQVAISGKRTMSIIAEVNVMASRLLEDDFVGGEMVWWRDDRKPRNCTEVGARMTFLFR